MLCINNVLYFLSLPGSMSIYSDDERTTFLSFPFFFFIKILYFFLLLINYTYLKFSLTFFMMHRILKTSAFATKFSYIFSPFIWIEFFTREREKCTLMAHPSMIRDCYHLSWHHIHPFLTSSIVLPIFSKLLLMTSHRMIY